MIAIHSFVFFAVTSIVLAAPQEFSNQCNTGDLYCCDSTTTSSDNSTSPLLESIGVIIEGLEVPIGTDCTPVTVGLGGQSCKAEPVCCEDNQIHGLVAVGCTPVNAL